jgi:predicted kinase
MIFVVGPSRGGKSTLVSAVAPEFPALRVLDLDAEEKDQTGGWEDRWHRNLECLRQAEASPSSMDLIVDVGRVRSKPRRAGVSLLNRDNSRLECLRRGS